MRFALALVLSLVALQENPVPCGREDDQARPEELVACRCYEQKDPCAEGEVKACKSYCDRSRCGCCQP